MFATKQNIRKSIIFIALAQVFSLSCLADEESDWVGSLKGEKDPPSKHSKATAEAQALTTEAVSNEYGTLNVSNPVSLKTHADAHLKAGHISTAIKLIEKSLALQSEDTDARQIYADALEQKVKTDAVRDPHTFNLCIKQWYFLYKNAEYPGIQSTAVSHLKELTGKSPYVWPTARMYFARVLMSEPKEGEAPTSVASDEPPQVH